MLALGVFLVAFAAEFASDAWAAFYHQAVRRLQRRRAVQWGVLLGVLGWVDLGGVAVGLPLWPLIAGSILGGAAGTAYAVHRMGIKARLRAKRKRERHDGTGISGGG